jgi:hypothetical protein
VPSSEEKTRNHVKLGDPKVWTGQGDAVQNERRDTMRSFTIGTIALPIIDSDNTSYDGLELELLFHMCPNCSSASSAVAIVLATSVRSP